MNCEAASRLLDLYLYGELPWEQEQVLEEHLANCDACRRPLEQVRALHDLIQRSQPGLPDTVLFDCRRHLRERLQAAAPPQRSWWVTVLRPAWGLRIVAAAALLVLGFFGGRWTASRPAPPIPQPSPDTLSARIRFIEQEPGGLVRIGIEERHQRTLRGRLDEEPIQRWLLAAAREAADPGLRLDSLDLLRARAQHEPVRRALLDAVQRDPNPGVRLKALEALKPFAAHPEVRETLAQILRSDENPGVRIQAIDLLIEQQRREDLVGLLQEIVQRESNDYVRLRCRQALQELNASVGTF